MKDLLDILKNIFEIFAIIAGGLWAYFHYFKGRVYKLRVEPKVFGEIISTNNSNYLLITTQIKNVGVSKFEIEQKGTAIRICSWDLGSSNWKHLKTLSIFEAHRWIESGELIEEQKLVPVQVNAYVAFLLEIRVVSKGLEWNANKIIK